MDSKRITLWLQELQQLQFSTAEWSKNDKKSDHNTTEFHGFLSFSFVVICAMPTREEAYIFIHFCLSLRNGFCARVAQSVGARVAQKK